MNRIQYMIRVMPAFVMLAILFTFGNISPAAAQPELPGWTQGTGTYFALPNSPYLPVTLDSSVNVTLTLSSVPEVVDLMIIPDTSAGSAQFTLSGFTANTLYYHYTDNGLNPVTFTTDATGSFTYTQDLSEGHHVWFRDQPSTYYLYDNAMGGDCTSFGTWSLATKTCTMTSDVSQPIFIQANGITLDGNGFSSLSTNNYAVYSYGFDDVTIENLNVSGSTNGIWAIYGTNLTVTNNTVSGGYFGIITFGDSNTSITNNTTTGQTYYGIHSGNYYYYFSGNNTIANNTVSSGDIGIYTDSYYGNGNNTIVHNTISDNNTGLYGRDDYSTSPSVIYNNNFLDNSTQIYFYHNSGGTSFNLAAPDGGNYYSNFNEPFEGCYDVSPDDGFCDAAYFFYNDSDNLPWTTQDGWLNQPPVARAGGPYDGNGNEGTAINIDGTGSSDPDEDTLTYAWSYTPGMGVDAGATCTFGGVTVASTTITCTDDGTYDLTLTVNDGTDSDSDSTTVDVGNVAPDLGNITITVDGTPEAAPVIPVGTTIDASASFTDDGSNDTHTAVWNWGDDASTDDTVTQEPGSGSVDDSHTYNIPGVYTVELTVTDDDDEFGTSSFEFVVVYDPDAGFVTGGGWIMSPSDACLEFCGGAEGKANFGFVSKYKKGASTPTGQTQFQFRAGDLNFHSDSYEWLVIAGANAKYKGEGTINGSGNYGFMLTATDGQINGGGGVDKFRIKIWDKDNGDVVIYDNQMGADDDDMSAGTELGGGSIVIHKK